MAALTSRSDEFGRFTIERMTTADLAEVTDVDSRCFSQSWPVAAYRQELRHPERSFYIVLRLNEIESSTDAEAIANRLRPRLTLLPFGKRIIESSTPKPVAGFAGMWVMFDEAHITTIGVDPRYQGEGLGEFLLTALIDEAIRRGAGFISLEVRVSNHVAQRLYEKYRFSVVGIRDEYYTDNREDALVMRSDRLDDRDYQRQLSELRLLLQQRLDDCADVPDLQLATRLNRLPGDFTS